MRLQCLTLSRPSSSRPQTLPSTVSSAVVYACAGDDADEHLFLIFVDNSATDYFSSFSFSARLPNSRVS
ncbi:hypothetical protein PIB30_037203, partial [Stylosanthes scabra]|nr:hypothetical protein [Stylosanthes scabra]